MRKHIVFDFDGTLVDTTKVIVKVYNELADQYKLKKLSQEEFQNMMNLPLRQKLKALEVSIFKVLRMRRIGQDFKEKYKSYLGTIDFCDGVLEVARQLEDKGYVLSILTSNSELNITYYLNSKQINIFQHISSSKGLMGKDQAIKKYMKEHQLSNQELIYIGDEVRDIQACKRNNVEVIAVSWGIYSRDLLLSEKPNYLIDDPHEIIKII
ncbi:phosphoglycolate phosphatase [Paenibacillus anaericanus]|uniref:HAD hydrolase-like protein n=1 Tax=Paenibacillus anaericanus TaxID=170367 RepID=UPI0027830ADF|nr:HAD hydrolase-like protein [Paenibacillus anaericanus]MDQ0088496.1 phosphoglycolate phosphatase [Paenibacillus anaericanus]